MVKTIDEITDLIMLNQALDTLDEKEKDVIRTRFFDGYSQWEAANCLGIPMTLISRVEKRAIMKLRRFLVG